MATYTHGHHESVLRSHRWRTAANSAAYLLPSLTPGASVLDVGCGPGTISVDLARRVGPTGTVLGVDNAATAVAAARECATQEGLATVSFATGDVYALDLDDDSFDVVHAHQVLQHLDRPVAALAELRRVARPGGVVAVRDCDYGASAWYPTSPSLTRWLELYQAVARRNGGEPDAGRRLLSWAQSAGFDSISTTASTWCFATPDDRSWWGGMWADRVTDSDFAEHAVAFGLATHSDLDAIATAWREWSIADDGWFALLHGEVLCHV